MKRKSLLLVGLGCAVTVLPSCGGSGEEASSENDSTQVEIVEELPGFEDICTDENSVFFEVENYESGMSGPLTYNGSFDIVRSEWIMLNDSTAELKMYNYELGAPDTLTNFQIYVKFNAKNGELLQEGVYAYQDYDQNLWSKVNVITPQGTVWFNWVMGMPDQGSVKLNYFSDEQACGEFSLEVNKPENTTIGHVVLKGNWKSE